MSETTTYSVPSMHCGHCEAAITRELEAVAGVESVDVDLTSGVVTVTSTGPVERGTIESAVDEAGYALA